MKTKYIQFFFSLALLVFFIAPIGAFGQQNAQQAVSIDPDSIPPNFTMKIQAASGAVYSLDSYSDFTRALVGIEQNKPIRLFGTALPGAELEISFCCPPTTKVTIADEEGDWDMTLDIEKKEGEQYLQVEEVGADRKPILIDLAVATYYENKIEQLEQNIFEYKLKLSLILFALSMSLFGIAWSLRQERLKQS